MKVTQDRELIRAIVQGNVIVEGAYIVHGGQHPVRVRFTVYTSVGARELELAFALEDGEVEKLSQKRSRS